MRKLINYAAWCRKKGTIYSINIYECKSKKEFKKYFKENGYEIKDNHIWLWTN